MKKRLIVLFFAVLILSLSVVANAADVVEKNGDVAVSQKYGVSEIETEETLYSRMNEFWETNKSEIITIATTIGSVASAIILMIKNFKKNNFKLNDALAKSDAVFKSQVKLDKSNVLVEAAVEKLGIAEEQMKDFVTSNKDYIEQLLTVCLNTQEMIMTVCSRSKDIPSQVKDLLDVKFVESARVMKSIESKSTENNSNE